MGAGTSRPTVIHLAEVTNETTFLESIENLENHIVEELSSRIARSGAKIIWNMGVGDGSGLLGFMLRMSEKAVCTLTNFDHVVRISLPSISEGCSSSDEMRNKAVMAIAYELKIMDEDNALRKLKNELEEEAYYTYKVNEGKESELVEQTTSMIYEKLASKSCLVIVENILQPINDPINKWLFNVGLPVPTTLGKINWVISTTSVDAYDRSKKETSVFFNHHIFNLSELIEFCWHPAAIMELELFHVAKSIQTNPPQKLTTIMDALWSCLLYSQLYSHNHENNAKEKSCSHCVQQNELVNLWISEGIFSRGSKVAHVTSFKKGDLYGKAIVEEEVADGQQELNAEHSSWSGDEMEILRALLSHCLLSSSTDASCVVPFSGMWELLTQWIECIPTRITEKTPWIVRRWKLIENIFDKEWDGKSWVSFFNDNGRWIIHPKPNPTTTLVLRGCSDLSKFSLDTLFLLLKHLRVLDLSYTPIEQIPPSLCEMINLRLLSLRGCNRLMTLTPDSSSNSSSSPFGPLEHLEFLDLGATSLDKIPDDLAKCKSKLRYLDLSCARITSLSSLFFQDASSSLKELFFLGCTLLESLPSSLTNLFSLETFSLSESRLVSFPIETFEIWSKLQDLNLINNKRLQSLPKLAGHASLKSFNLSGSPITHLSLRACQSLEIVCLHDLDQLEVLDLSATAIKDFPICISELRKLKRLDLLALPRVRRLPWHNLQHIPVVLNLDQCECVEGRIFVTDSRLLSSITIYNATDLIKKGGLLQSFYISVSSCNKRSKNDRDIGFTCQSQNMKLSCYRDVPLTASTFKQQFKQGLPLNRHVEISSPDRHPDGLEGIFEVTKSLSVWDDTFVSSLSNLNGEFSKLKECKLRQCHSMDSIFESNTKFQGDELQTLWAFDLQKMTKVLCQLDNVGFLGGSEFTSLKHVHLEYCPRLESIFPGDMMLESLETLTVVHCGNLRTIFYKDVVKDKDQFQRLHTIQLHELPKLSHLCEKQSIPLRMEKWKELHFRGCWNLQQLPLLMGRRNHKVQVDGEARQCKKLKASMGEDQLSCYDFKSPPPLVSFKEHVKNKIFLTY